MKKEFPEAIRVFQDCFSWNHDTDHAEDDFVAVWRQIGPFNQIFYTLEPWGYPDQRLSAFDRLQLQKPSNGVKNIMRCLSSWRTKFFLTLGSDHKPIISEEILMVGATMEELGFVGKHEVDVSDDGRRELTSYYTKDVSIKKLRDQILLLLQRFPIN